MKRYARLAPGWQEEADGCGRCLLLGSPTAEAIVSGATPRTVRGPPLAQPSALLAATACREAQFIVLPKGVELGAASERCDEALERVLYADPDEEGSA